MDADDCLDILGQQPLLNIYTQLCLVFPVPDPSSHHTILDTLTVGLGRLAADLPWVAGQVTRKSPSDNFQIVPLDPAPSLTVRDLRQDGSVPTLDELRRARFPFRMLDENIFASHKTLPGGVAGEGPIPTPVFAVQANFITGGLVLTFVSQHQTMDLTGQRQIMSLMSRTCRGEQLTDADIAAGNPTRRGRIPLLGNSYVPGPEMEFQMVKPAPAQPASDEAPTPAVWAYFAFSPESLAAIKLVAQKNMGTPPGYVSTDDALTAFIWQSVGRVRVARLGLSAKSTLGRAVDVRRHLGFPPTYPGLLQCLSYQSNTLQDLVHTPLGSIASQLRLAVEPATSKVAYNTRALATMIDRAEDKAMISVTAGIDPSADLMISSWTNPSFYGMDFGLGLGNPEAVRRPCFDPVESLVYFMPKPLRGELVVAICLASEDMLALRSDGEFSRHTVYIG